jgi:very-short-patch-repair endonuclease
MVAASYERIGPLTQESDMRRFNVAASRAQEQMWLFHSVTNSELSEQCYRRKLMNHFYLLRPQPINGVDVDALRQTAHTANRIQERQVSPFDSWFEVDVALAIAGRGYRVIPQFKFAGKFIDLVVQGNKPQLAVECDGDKWHGPDAYEADMARQRMLERCGWHFFRIRASRYYANPDKALETLWSKLEKMGIYPESQQHLQDDDREELEESFECVENVHEQEGGSGGYDVKEFDQGNNQLPLPLVAGRDLPNTKSPLIAPSISGISPAPRLVNIPTTIQEALTMKPTGICGLIIEILKTRSNNSCKRENMPTYLLKEWNIRTRGTPRDIFAKKVDDQIAIMVRKGDLIAYRSKNDRIKLGWNMYSEEN